MVEYRVVLVRAEGKWEYHFGSWSKARRRYGELIGRKTTTQVQISKHTKDMDLVIETWPDVVKDYDIG